jgi:hypothetical protein
MNCKQVILYLLIQSSVISVLTAQQVAFTDSELVEKILRKEYHLYYSKDVIDKKFVRLLKKEEKFDLTLAEPGQDFNFTDMSIDGFPNKSLIMVGKSLDQIGFVLYENGGNARYNVCLIYRTKKNKYEIEAIRLSNDINSLEKLKNAIACKNFVVLK